MFFWGNKSTKNTQRKAYLVGGGIASLAAAVYLIKDGKFNPANITVFEKDDVPGGSLDGEDLAKNRFFARGERMFVREIYSCTLDLMSHVPLEPGSHKTLLDDFNEFNADPTNQWYAKARIIAGGDILDAKNLQLSARDELDIIKLFAVPESALSGVRINEIFSPAFFNTNYWYILATSFAFQPWHSAMEARRYAWRFMQHMPQMSDMKFVVNTRYNQYDSMVAPMTAWLREKGVRFLLGARVDALHFTSTEDQQERVASIDYIYDRKRISVTVSEDDLTFFINGSMTANSSIGGMKRAPRMMTSKPNDSWAIWQEIAKNRPHFGNPSAFLGPLGQTKWESFSITFSNTLFSDLLEIFSKNKPGTGGIITIKDSRWFLSFAIPTNPHFAKQPENTNFVWGYGLRPDEKGKYVKKKMIDCTGAEILTELCHHLGFAKELKEILASADCVPCMMPYITSQFMPRKVSDRPRVLPDRTKNLAFIGQYCEIPDEIVFTVEQSVRSAMIAVYGLLGIDKEIPPIYQGQRDPNVVKQLIDMGYNLAVTQEMLKHEPSEKNYVEA